MILWEKELGSHVIEKEWNEDRDIWAYRLFLTGQLEVDNIFPMLMMDNCGQAMVLVNF